MSLAPFVGDRFVVGTGRCGSTLLSRMLGRHEQVTALHEFFTGLDWGTRFTPGTVDGPTLAEIISVEQAVATDVLARGLRTDEITYPFEQAGVAHRPGDAMPWLLVSMVGHLLDETDPDPDALFEALVHAAHHRPPAPMAEHYRALFAWLAARTGAPVWIERSGSSVDYLGDLIDLFPGGRFVHIHRDGVEAALSIRAHPFFRLALAVYYDLFPAGVPAEDAIDAAIAEAPPVWTAGRFWSDQVLHGFAALAHLDADQYLEVRFEDLVTDPGPVLTRIADFFELPADPGFVARAGAMARGLPPMRAGELGPDELEALTAEVRPGQVLLGRA